MRKIIILLNNLIIIVILISLKFVNCFDDKIISGTYEHSYMGLYYIAGNTSNLVRSAGYPALVKSSNNELYEHSMWTMYPIENSIIGNGNTFKSTEIVISNGNSGGPLYGYHTGIEYGHQYKYAYLYGITVASSTSEYENQLSKFNFSLSVRIRPVNN